MFNKGISRILKYSWIIIIFTIISAFASFWALSKETYQANITLGLNFNSPSFLETKQDSVFGSTPNFVDTQGKLSRFLENRLASVESQKIIVNELDLEVNNLNSDKPIYKLSDQELAFITVTYSTSDKAKAEKFNQVMQLKVYPSITNQWNDGRLANFQITPAQNPVQSVQTISNSIQNKLVAPVSVLLISTIVIGLWPYSDKNNFEKTSK